MKYKTIISNMHVSFFFAFTIYDAKSGGKLLPQSDLRGGVFLEVMSCRHYNKKECKEQKEHHSYKIGTWNIRTLKQGGKRRT
jgi:hypothetical protein